MHVLTAAVLFEEAKIFFFFIVKKKFINLILRNWLGRNSQTQLKNLPSGVDFFVYWRKILEVMSEHVEVCWTFYNKKVCWESARERNYGMLSNDFDGLLSLWGNFCDWKLIKKEIIEELNDLTSISQNKSPKNDHGLKFNRFSLVQTTRKAFTTKKNRCNY